MAEPPEFFKCKILKAVTLKVQGLCYWSKDVGSRALLLQVQVLRVQGCGQKV